MEKAAGDRRRHSEPPLKNLRLICVICGQNSGAKHLKMRTLPPFLALVLFSTAFPALRADDTRVQIATANGQPVYRSQVFSKQSVIKDEVDRALILQDYERSDNVLSPELTSKAMENIVKTSYGGNADRLVTELARYGISPQDYVRFVAEELAIQATLKEHEVENKNGAWVAGLRKAAAVEMLPKPVPAPGGAATPTPAPPPAEPTPTPRVADPRRH